MTIIFINNYSLGSDYPINCLIIMKKLTIEYSKRTCIGNGSCVAAAPTFFRLEDGKSVCIGAKQHTAGDLFTLDVSCDNHAAESIINAGLSCPVNAIRITNNETKEVLVSSDINTESAKEVVAVYDDAKEFVLDTEGYFLIRLDRVHNQIEVAFCNKKNNIVLKVKGKKPIDIYHTILNREKLHIRHDHAAYLGRELQKAYVALENDLDYVQDDELDLKKKYIRK